MNSSGGGLSIVGFPFHDARKAELQGVRWRDGHLLEQFSNHPAVGQLLIVDRPTSAAERLFLRSPSTVRGVSIGRKRQGRAIAAVTRTAERVAVLDIALPDVVGPIARGREWWFEVFARDDVLALIEWAVAEVMPVLPSVIAWTPTAWPAISRLAYRRFVFDSLDNWIVHPHLRRHAASAERGYEVLLPSANAVVVSAPRSKAVLARWAPDIEIIPNGVDPSVFELPAERPADLPHGPVVGYAGTLGPRIDVDLVLDVAQRLPNVSFVFIGPDPGRRLVERIAALRRFGQPGGRSLAGSRPNIHVLGDRHYRSVPGYIQNFDVAWIPHRVGEGESGGDPIKLYEYWAAGRPVVATRIDGLDRWESRLHLVQGGADAAATIEGVLSGRIRAKAGGVPADRTWARIAERFLALLAVP